MSRLNDLDRDRFDKQQDDILFYAKAMRLYCVSLIPRVVTKLDRLDGIINNLWDYVHIGDYASHVRRSRNWDETMFVRKDD